MSAIFDKALDFLPSWVPFAVVGLLLAGLAGAGWALKASWQAEGAASVVAADRQAVIDQQKRDAALSAELIENQAIELGALRVKSDTIITRIERVPVTTGCGPVMRDASRGLHDLFNGAGGTPAGR